MEGDSGSNVASEFLRAAFQALNSVESRPTNRQLGASLTDDFSSEDRRHGPTFPKADADAFGAIIGSSWEVGAGQPRFLIRETMAVRGERFAACLVALVYGNGMTSDSITVLALDPTLTMMQRSVVFDDHDVDAAIAELDRLHRQANAS